MSDEMKDRLRKQVFEALDNAAQGDTATEQYQNGPTDCIAHDLWDFSSDVQEEVERLLADNAFELVRPDLEELVEEWKAGRVKKTVLRLAEEINDMDADAPNYEKDEP